MNTAPMNYVLLLLPFCISLGVLALILLLREHQHSAIQKGLIDRLLVSQGHNPLPEIEPMITGESDKKELAEKIEETVAKIKRMRQSNPRVSFPIPNMPQPRTGMGEVKR